MGTLIALTSMNDNDTNLLKLPEIVPRSGRYCYEDDKLMHETKLVWARVINKAILGVVELTEDDKQSLWGLNALCIKLGYAPFDVDLENL